MRFEYSRSVEARYGMPLKHYLTDVARGRQGQPSALVFNGRTLQSSCGSEPLAGYDGYHHSAGYCAFAASRGITSNCPKSSAGLYFLVLAMLILSNAARLLASVGSSSRSHGFGRLRCVCNG